MFDDAEEENGDILTPTPARRIMLGKGDFDSAIPAPTTSVKKMASGIGVGRRISSGAGIRREEGDMGPPERKRLSGVGETF